MSSKSGLSIQFIMTATGDRLVVIPEAEYQLMVEALEDRADAEAARLVLDRIASGEEETIPSEFVHRMVQGENTVKVWREFRGMTTDSLAEKAGVSLSDLCEVENDVSDARLGTIKKIAAALGVDFDDLA